MFYLPIEYGAMICSRFWENDRIILFYLHLSRIIENYNVPYPRSELVPWALGNAKIVGLQLYNLEWDCSISIIDTVQSRFAGGSWKIILFRLQEPMKSVDQ